jgi:hypothetical protein
MTLPDVRSQPPTASMRSRRFVTRRKPFASTLTRDRRFGKLRYKRSRAEQKQILIEQGCEFFKDSGCKHRFVGIFGDRRTKRILRAALKWNVMEYPKRPQSPEDRVQVVGLDPVPTTFAAASAP